VSLLLYQPKYTTLSVKFGNCSMANRLSDGRDGGTPWGSALDVTDASGNGASCLLAPAGQSEWLLVDDLGLVFPAGASIDHVDLSFDFAADVPRCVRVHRCRLVSAGAIGSDEGVLSPLLAGTEFTRYYAAGWDHVFTDQSVPQVRAAARGIALRAENVGTQTATIMVRRLRMRIYYQLPVVQPGGGVF
jgi:hypothetical protein